MSRKVRKICAFSGKRGGFGAYVPFMQLVQDDTELELQILLGDMHGSKEFGSTVTEAREMFPSANIRLIEMGTGRGDSSLIRTENLGTCLNKVAGILSNLNPDVLMVHGDRGEHLIVAFAALNLGIPIGHTQGGEISGNIDDTQRHAITKLAHLHFPETEMAAERIRALGEEPWRINVVGSTYIDRIKKKMFTPVETLRTKYELGEKERYFITLFHPDTYETREKNYRMMSELLATIKATGHRSFVVFPCSDPGYEGVLKAIEESKNSTSFLIHKNIENLDFLGLMSSASCLLGNSSSAIVEAPYFQLPCINLGKRQMGRDREENVLDVPNVSKESIMRALDEALYSRNFRDKLVHCGKRLGNGDAGEKILSILKNIIINNNLLRKKLV